MMSIIHHRHEIPIKLLVQIEFYISLVILRVVDQPDCV